MNDKKIPTLTGTIVIIIIAVTVGMFVWKYEKNSEIVQLPVFNQQTTPSVSNTAKINNHYLNSDYGFSLDLPYALDKYVVQVFPNTIARISFLLPATNQKFIEYTGHALADAFNILAYPKSEISAIKQGCERKDPKYNLLTECVLENEQPIAENDVYYFYYLKGGVIYDAYPQALENSEYSKSKYAMQTLKTAPATLIFDANKWHVFTAPDYGYEMEYPSNWNAGSSDSPSIFRQSSVLVFSTSGQMADSANGSLLLSKVDTYNSSLTDTIEGNIKLLNLKDRINILGSNSSFKEVKIIGGRAFYNSVQTSIASNERNIYVIGEDAIFTGNISVSSDKMNAQNLTEFADILSHFKFLQIPPADTNNATENFKVSDFEKWKDYKYSYLKLKYPAEFHLSTFGGSDPGVHFYYLNPDNLKNSTIGYSLPSFTISVKQNKTIPQHLDDFKNVLNNLKQEQIDINGISADKISYTDPTGGILYKILIQKGSDLIVISYAGGNQLEDTFNHMLSTVNIF